jgi:class 3 adenylate cyclase
MSEKLDPEEVTTIMGDCYAVLGAVVSDYGGIVDKYIGDSIVAVFGAPADDRDHASNAAQAALACSARLAELNRSSAAFGGHEVAHRMGLNSGEALVGNIGSRRRFNYSVMGDAVNVASRLEGANKYYGTTIIASETTVALTETKFAWRELDAVRVRGRSGPVRIYELLAEAGQETPQQVASAAAYAEGLAHWRTRGFDAAATCFERVAGIDKPSALFLGRANAFRNNPPGPDWDPVSTLEGK